MEFELTDDLEFFQDSEDTAVETVEAEEENVEVVDGVATETIETGTEETDVDTNETAASTEDDSAIFTSAFDVFKEKGILSVPEDFKFEPTEEGFTKALEATAEKIREEVIEALKADLPAEGLALIKYMKDGGKDIAKFKEVYSEPDYSTFEAADDDTRKAVLKTYYQKTTKWTPAKIDKHLVTLEVSGELEESFDEAKTELVAIQAKEKEGLHNAAINAEKTRRDNEQKAIDSLSKVIQEKTEINGYPINKTDVATVIPFLMKPVKVGDRITTLYNQKHAEIMRDPEKAVLLAKLVQSGLDLSVLDVKKTTTAVKTLKSNLKSALNFKGVVQDTQEDTSWDELENI